jgi:hypothetical protein
MGRKIRCGCGQIFLAGQLGTHLQTAPMLPQATRVPSASPVSRGTPVAGLVKAPVAVGAMPRHHVIRRKRRMPQLLIGIGVCVAIAAIALILLALDGLRLDLT